MRSEVLYQILHLRKLSWNNFILPQLQDFFNTQFKNGIFQRLRWMQHVFLLVKEGLPEIFNNFEMALQHGTEWTLQ